MDDFLDFQRDATNIGSNAVELAVELNQPDLATDLREHLNRMTNPLSRVVVCGGFEQGKSSLLNALLNGRVSPADPAIATAVPLTVADGDAMAAVYLDGDSTSTQEIEVGDLVAVLKGQTTEIAGREVIGALLRTRRGPLARGVILVDTPPITGGLASQEAIRVLTEVSRARLPH